MEWDFEGSEVLAEADAAKPLDLIREQREETSKTMPRPPSANPDEQSKVCVDPVDLCWQIRKDRVCEWGCANAQITDDCELVRIASYQHRAPAQRFAGELLIRRSEQLAAKCGANVRIRMVCELVRIANYQHRSRLDLAYRDY